MDDEDIDKSKITFRTHFVTFVSQAITGVLFPFYKDITDDGTFKSFSKEFCINQFHDLNVPQKIIISNIICLIFNYRYNINKIIHNSFYIINIIKFSIKKKLYFNLVKIKKNG